MKTRFALHRIAVIVVLALLVAGTATSQSRNRHPRPIPIPPRPPSIEGETDVNAKLDGSILQVRAEQTFINHGHGVAEVEILLPVPADAVVSDGLLLADGKEYRAEVLDADEARAIYESIVRSRRDPALIELVGHGLLRLSAFPIPPGGERTVSFRYHQSLPATEGRTRLLLPLAALCGLDHVGPLRFQLTIEGDDPILQVYSPSHDLEIERDGRTTAHVLYEVGRPDLNETLELITVRDSRAIGIDLRTADGYGDDDYFLLAVSPGWDLLNARRDHSETKVLVLDTSGSMEGEKFKQAREAVHRFLEEISPRDRFNLIAFSDHVRSVFDSGPRRATPENRRQAQRWLDRLDPGGGTAIAEAIDEAFHPSWEADLVLFLTDGLPTVGETSPESILRRASRVREDLRFYAFGVGYDVDAHLLDDLARLRGGSVTYVKPGEDVAEAVTTLRHRVEHPAARNVRLDIRGAEIEELFPKERRDLFAGEPLLFAGRVRPGSGRATVRLTAEGPDGQRLRESWRIDFDDAATRSSAVPVLWASRKAASLIDEIRREGRSRRLVEELRELSRRYGILNEEMALLAREDEPLLADGRDRRPNMILHSAPAPSLGQRKSSRGSGALNFATPQDAEEEVKTSAEAWRLQDAGSISALKEKNETSVANRTLAGVSFRLDGEVWIDTRLDAPLPKKIETIRVKPFGEAYFKLVANGGRIAEWLSVGEELRVLLPGILLEIIEDGEDQLGNATMKRVVTAGSNARSQSGARFSHQNP